jgi:hypothetical protein
MFALSTYLHITTIQFTFQCEMPRSKNMENKIGELKVIDVGARPLLLLETTLLENRPSARA